MNKITRNNKTKMVIAIGLFTILCGACAMTPLWVNPCTSTHLSEAQIKQAWSSTNYEYWTSEQRVEYDQQLRQVVIPCGAENLPIKEILGARKFQSLILGELAVINKLLILRFEMVGTDDLSGAYYFKAYTFFYIPLYRVFAGGSGYMEIDMLPFETNEVLDIGEWK